MTFSGSNLLAALLPALCAAAGLPPSTAEAQGDQAAAAPADGGQPAGLWCDAFAPFLEAALPAGQALPAATRKIPAGVTDLGARLAVSAGKRSREQDESDLAGTVRVPAIAGPAILPLHLQKELATLSLPSGAVLPPVAEVQQAPDVAPETQAGPGMERPASSAIPPIAAPRVGEPLIAVPPVVAPSPVTPPPVTPTGELTLPRSIPGSEPEEAQGAGAMAAVALPPAQQPDQTAPETGINVFVAALPPRRLEPDREQTLAATAPETKEAAPARASTLPGLHSLENPRAIESPGPKPDNAEAGPEQPAVESRTATTPEPAAALPPGAVQWSGLAGPSPPASPATEPQAPVERTSAVPGGSEPPAASAPAPGVVEKDIMPAGAEWAFAARIVAAVRPAEPATAEFSRRQAPRDTSQTSLPDSPPSGQGQRPAPSRASLSGGANGTPGRTPLPETAGEEQASIGGQTRRPATSEAVRVEAQKPAQSSVAQLGRAVTQQPKTERAGEISSALPVSPPALGNRSSSPADPPPADGPQPLKSTTRAEEVTRLASLSPAREMNFRLAETGRGPAVEVRVKDQAGELRVAVRTTDGTLAKSLREGLPELVERLGQQGYETQVWRPGGSGSLSAQGGIETRTRQADFGGGAGDQGQRDGNQDGSAEQRGSKQQEESPAWSEQWQTSLGTKEP